VQEHLVRTIEYRREDNAGNGPVLTRVVILKKKRTFHGTVKAGREVIRLTDRRFDGNSLWD
jgi:hypothetical protein